MRFTLLHALALLAATGPLACSVDNALSFNPTTTTDKTDGKALYFEQEGTLTLAPGEVRKVAVHGSGEGALSVAFSLLGNVGDAFVEASVVETDGQGVATAVLHAPNQATTFTLRAALVGDDGHLGSGAELSVAVSDEGFGAVRVLPQYTGKRAVEVWTASVVARTTCADLSSVLPGEPEGSLVATASPGAAPLVDNAPVGPSLAVTLRAGHYAWGCADVSTLAAGSTLDVKVTVFDKPVVLAATDLDLNLDFQPDPLAFQKLADNAGYLLREGFAPSALDESTVLLDQMSLSLPPAQIEPFIKQRLAQDWDELAADHFSSLDASLRDHLSVWIDAGLPLPAGTLTGNLKAKEGEDGLALLTVGTLGGISAEAAGIPETSAFTWTADPSDALSLKGLIHWQPSRLVGQLALTGATKEIQGVSSVPEALGFAADCDGLAVKLGSFPGCDSACLAALCRTAIATRWDAALSASTDAGILGHIAITAAGPATLDDQAQPVGFDGVWVGSIGDNVVSIETKGAISGTPPSISPPP